MPSQSTGRVPRVALSCMLSVFCIAPLPIAAQAPKPPFTATISAEVPAVKSGPDNYIIKAGSEIFITSI